ncbi:hypothetical protein PYW07_013140 [Mythimna separata]|uniref:Bromo domain-containing protein n=1 Tax=Mythimna separata TaxID=271217 RepID=A0AAD7Y5R1_MYTSE|nr:hypothetical protein PYW07_013140 [Mythimna separata]
MALLCVMKDVRWLASTSTDCSVAFWTCSPDGQFLSQPVQYVERMRPGVCHMICAAWSAGGAFLAAGSADHHVRIYTVEHEPGGPKRVLETPVHDDAVDSIAWAHRGLRFVSGSKDGSAALWTLHATQWRHVLLQPKNTQQDGKKLKMTMVCWDISDAFVMTAVSDNTILVWCARAGACVRSLRAHRDEAYVLEAHPFLPGVFLSAGHDGQLFVWDAKADQPIANFHNRIDGHGDGAIFDAKWGSGSTVAATDSHGHLLLLGLGKGHRLYGALPPELFFHTDYRPVVLDAHGGAHDEQTDTPPHLLPPPFLVDVEGAPHAPEYQRLVPGRENLALSQLIPAADAPRSRIDAMIEALAVAGGREPRGVWRGEGVRYTAGSWQRGDPLLVPQCTRPIVQPLSYAAQEHIHKTCAELNALEQSWYRREMRRRPLMISTATEGGGGPRRRAGRRARGPAERPRPRPRLHEEPPEPESASCSDTSDEWVQRATRHDRSTPDSRNSSLDLSDTDTSSSSSSQYSDWEAGAALAPPARARRRPLPTNRPSTVVSKRVERAPPAPASPASPGAPPPSPPPAPELPDAYRPGEWLTAVSPRKAPYHPQMGDQCLYFRLLLSPASPGAPPPSPPPAPELPDAYRPGEWLTAVSPRKAPYHPQMGDQCLYFRLLLSPASPGAPPPSPPPAPELPDAYRPGEWLTAVSPRKAPYHPQMGDQCLYFRLLLSPASPGAPPPSPPPAPELPDAYRPGEWLTAVSPRKAPYHPQMGDQCLYFRLLLSPASPGAPPPSPPPAPELPDAYRPGEWLTAVSPRKAPYHPQMGDQCLYFRLGHQRYFEAVAEKDVYKVNPRDKPWERTHVYECELVKVVGIKYVIKPPRVACLRLACSLEGEGPARARSLTVRYHDMPDVIDFLVLRQQYDAAIARAWGPGDRFRCMIDDCWWTGQVLETTGGPASSAESALAVGLSGAAAEAWARAAAAHFLSLRVRWDNSEVERLSPWDLEPLDPERLPQVAGGAVAVLPHELEAVLYRAEASEWPPRGDRAAACRAIAQHIGCVMSLSAAEAFVAPVDLQQYPAYARVVPYPIDLATIRARFDNLFYRRAAAAQFDVRYLASNAEQFNEAHSPIVRQARLVTDLLLRIIAAWREVDVLAEYRDLAAAYHSSDDEPLRAPPPPKSRRSGSRSQHSWRAACGNVLTELSASADAEPFRQPVSPDQAPDYCLVVAEPMDLGTVRTRLLEGAYSRAEQFARDVRLVFSNSRLYNTNKRSRIYSMTVRLSALFEALWSRYTASSRRPARPPRPPRARRPTRRTRRAAQNSSTQMNGTAHADGDSGSSDSETLAATSRRVHERERTARDSWDSDAPLHLPRKGKAFALSTSSQRHDSGSSDSETLAATSRRVHERERTARDSWDSDAPLHLPRKGKAFALSTSSQRHDSGSSDSETLAATSRRVHERERTARDSWDSDAPLHLPRKGKGVGKKSKSSSASAEPAPSTSRAADESYSLANGSRGAPSSQSGAEERQSASSSEHDNIRVVEEELRDDEVELTYESGGSRTHASRRQRKRRRARSDSSASVAYRARSRTRHNKPPKRTRERFTEATSSSSSVSSGSTGGSARRYESDRSYRPRYSSDDDAPLHLYRTRLEPAAEPAQPPHSTRTGAGVSLRARRAQRQYNEDSEEDSVAAISKRLQHHHHARTTHAHQASRRRHHAEQVPSHSQRQYNEDSEEDSVAAISKRLQHHHHARTTHAHQASRRRHHAEQVPSHSQRQYNEDSEEDSVAAISKRLQHHHHARTTHAHQASRRRHHAEQVPSHSQRQYNEDSEEDSVAAISKRLQHHHHARTTHAHQASRRRHHAEQVPSHSQRQYNEDSEEDSVAAISKRLQHHHHARTTHAHQASRRRHHAEQVPSHSQRQYNEDSEEDSVAAISKRLQHHHHARTTHAHQASRRRHHAEQVPSHSQRQYNEDSEEDSVAAISKRLQHHHHARTTHAHQASRRRHHAEQVPSHSQRQYNEDSEEDSVAAISKRLQHHHHARTTHAHQASRRRHHAEQVPSHSQRQYNEDSEEDSVAAISKRLQHHHHARTTHAHQASRRRHHAEQVPSHSQRQYNEDSEEDSVAAISKRLQHHHHARTTHAHQASRRRHHAEQVPSHSQRQYNEDSEEDSVAAISKRLQHHHHARTTHAHQASRRRHHAEQVPSHSQRQYNEDSEEDSVAAISKRLQHHHHARTTHAHQASRRRHHAEQVPSHSQRQYNEDSEEDSVAAISKRLQHHHHARTTHAHQASRRRHHAEQVPSHSQRQYNEDSEEDSVAAISKRLQHHHHARTTHAHQTSRRRHHAEQSASAEGSASAAHTSDHNYFNGHAAHAPHRAHAPHPHRTNGNGSALEGSSGSAGPSSVGSGAPGAVSISMRGRVRKLTAKARGLLRD